MFPEILNQPANNDLNIRVQIFYNFLKKSIVFMTALKKSIKKLVWIKK